MRENTEGANKARLDFAKKQTISGKPFFGWLKLRSSCTRVKKLWRRLGTAHDPKLATLSVKHGGAVWWRERAWLPVAQGYWCLVVMWQGTEEAGRILKCIRISSAKMQVVWAGLHSKMDNDPKHTAKPTQEFFKLTKCNILQWPQKSISWSQPDWACISLAED